MHVLITGASWKVTLIVGIHIWAVFIIFEEMFLLGPPSHLYLAHQVLGLNHSLPFVLPQTTHALGQGQRPNIWFRPLTLQQPFKTPVFSSHPRRKLGFWIFKSYFYLILWFTRVGVSFHVPYNCYWCFKDCEAPFIAPGGALFPRSNSEVQIQRLIFLLEFWAGSLPLISPSI